MAEDKIKKAEETNPKKKKSNHVKELEDKIKSLEEEVLRSKADLINYRKRKDEEVSNMLKYANGDFISNLLPILDNFDRAFPKDEQSLSSDVKNFLIGFKMINKSFKEVLEANGIKEIDCLNKPFDAKISNCIYTEENPDIEDDIVTEVFTKGYTYYDKILRCASVKVNKINENKENDKNE